MPRVTRRSLASKKDEEAPQSSGGKRGSKKAEPVEEPEPIGEPSPSKTARRGKAAAVPKEEPPKGRTTSRGRGKKEEVAEEIIEEKESPAPKRGGRGGRGKKDEQEAPPPTKRAARGRGKKEEEPEEEEEEEDDEEELPPPAKKPARGGRGKKEEVVEAPVSKRGSSRGGRAKKEESDEAESTESLPTPDKAAPKGRGRSGARGKKSATPAEEEEEEVTEEVAEEEEKPKVEASPKGRQSRTPTKPQTTTTPSPSSGGRRSGGRGKRGASVAAEEEPEAEAQVDAAGNDEPVKTDEEQPKQNEEKTEDVAKMEVPTEEMEVDAKSGAEDAAPVVQNMEEEIDTGKKRKLEEDDEEEASSSKKARVTEETPTATNKDEDTNDISDFVVIDKDDLPAADSKEVQAALPPPVEEMPNEADNTEPTTTANEPVAPSAMSAPTIVPLTEAELGKQYNPAIRMDRDDNSSMMVECGSEAASDVGSVSRNLDVSEVTSADLPGQDDSVSSTDVSDKLTESSTTTSNEIPLPHQQTQQAAAAVGNESTAAAATQSTAPPAVVEIAASIPLPTDKSSSSLLSSPVQQQQQPAAVTPPVLQSSLSPAPSLPSSTPFGAPAIVPSPTPTPAAQNQVNSIPLPPNYNMSNSTSPPQQPADIPSQQQSQQSMPPTSTIPPAAQNATAQNGSCKPNEQVSQSLPIHTSTPAKKSVILDSNYVPSSPSITQRKFISNRNFPIELMDPAFCFSVVSYNILADCHLRRYDYSYTEPQHLDLSYRHSLFLKELDFLDGDVVCMQEVDTQYYSDTLLPAMTSRGYQGMFKKRTQDWYAEGAATFVKTSKFEVLSYEGISLKDLAYEEIEAAGLTGDVSRAAKQYLDRADVVLVCKLLSKKTGKHLTVGNIHVLFDPKAPDVQCIQVASAVKELVSKAGSDLNPYIICGDFNSESTSPAYQLAKDGYLSDEHIRILQNIQSMDNTEGASRSIIHYLWKAFQHTSSNMKSAYETCVGREPAITSLNGLVKACLDYIFYSSSTLYTVGALEFLDPQVVEATGGLPSKDIPSDHLSSKAVFRLKD